MHKTRAKLASLYGIMFCLAIGTVVLGTLTPQMGSAYRLSPERIGWIAAFQSAGGIIALFVGSTLLDRLEPYSATLTFFLGLCLSLMVMWRIPAYPVFLGAAFVFGIFQQLLMVTVTVSIASLFPDTAPRWTGLAHTIYGIGSVLAPLCSGFLAAKQKWNLSFLAVALVGSLFLISGLLCRDKKELFFTEGCKRQNEHSPFHLTSSLLVLCLAAFCYMGHLGLVSTWLPVYLAELEAPNVGLVLSGFWLGIVVGRMGYSLIGPSLSEKRTICLGCAMGAAAIAAAFCFNSDSGWIGASVTLGIFTGPLLPLLLSLPSSMIHESAGSATSMVLLTGTAGNLLCVWLAGTMARAIGTRYVIFCAAILLLLMIPLAATIKREDNRNQQS